MQLRPLAIGALLLAGCGTDAVVFTPLPREVYVGYRLAGDTLHVARLLKTAKQYEFHRSVIVEGPETQQQGDIPIRVVPQDSLVAVQAQLQVNYQWRPFKSHNPEVLFVQVDPSREHQKETLLSIMAIMNERGSIEDAIDEDLQSRHLGQWSAGDLGPGGMNMLFDVTSATKALPVVVKALETKQAQSRARVARRLMTAPDDWRYEVVYPTDYSGAFNSM